MIPEHVQSFVIYAAGFYCLIRWGGSVFLLAALYQVWLGEWDVAAVLAFFAALFDTVRRCSEWTDYIDFCRRQHTRRR